MNGKPCVSCQRAALPDDVRCRDCRWAQWTLREPEWVIRAKAKQLPAVDLTGRAA